MDFADNLSSSSSRDENSNSLLTGGGGWWPSYGTASVQGESIYEDIDEFPDAFPSSSLLQRIAGNRYSEILNNPYTFVGLSAGITLISILAYNSPDSSVLTKSLVGVSLGVLSLLLIGGIAIHYGERQRVQKLEEFQDNSGLSFICGDKIEEFSKKARDFQELVKREQEEKKLVEWSTYDDPGAVPREIGATAFQLLTPLIKRKANKDDTEIPLHELNSLQKLSSSSSSESTSGS